MAAEGDIMNYIFTGVVADDLPNEDFRVIVHESVNVIPAQAFYQNQNIVELICHAGVEKIDREAFCQCPRLKRVVIPGVKLVEDGAFFRCEAVTDIECGKLKTIGEYVFLECNSLRSIDLPSAKYIFDWAFEGCEAMEHVKFGKNLKLITFRAFAFCPCLERITIPLKGDLCFGGCGVFQACTNLKSMDLVEGELLRDTVAALTMEEWRNDMNEKIDSINQILLNASAGTDGDDWGEKATVIEVWIEGVLEKIIRYRAEHLRIVEEAATTLQLVMPEDIVMSNVLPFLELPPHAFADEEEDEGDSDNESYSSSESEEDGREEDEDDEDDNSEQAREQEEEGVEGGDMKRRKT